ncbi:kinase-like domain-containing protein [Obelidium mucronatum]|nr:kinase-like domain-containing protein [Obelidium mucronatum]
MPDLETRKSKIQALSQSKASFNATAAPSAAAPSAPLTTASPPKSCTDITAIQHLSPPPPHQNIPPHYEDEETPIEEEENFTQRIPLKDDNQEYYDYVMLSQRHASSNFITKIGSGEIDYGTPETVVKIIGPYVMGEQIGKGAYGKVKEGLCSETLQRVAIKIINKKRLRKIPNGVENALSEIKLLRRMKHRNIIMLIDVYCKVEDDEGNVGIFNWFSTIEDEPITWTYDDGSVAEKKVVVMKWYLVFEYCPCSLQTLLEQSEMKKLTAFNAHKFFVQLIDGLEYLHSQSIIHRDIKAGNLLITPDGVVKISDFGVTEQFSMYQSKEMISELFAGTHQFMAPEICEGQGAFEATKVDIWACGVTLYNMLSGRYPFEFPEDGNLLGLYERIVVGKFEMPTGLDHDLENLLQGLLCVDPKQRLGTMQIQKHPWYLAYFEETMKPQPPIMSYPSSDFAAPDMGAALKPALPPKQLAVATKEPTVTASNNELLRKKSAEKKAKYQSIISLHQKETPCETTMIPFLSELCSREIEEELVTIKRFIDMVGRDDDFKEPVVEDSNQGLEGKAVARSTGHINQSGGIKSGSGKLGSGGVHSKEAETNLVDDPDTRKRKPFKMFFKNLFHAKDNSVKPRG